MVLKKKFGRLHDRHFKQRIPDQARPTSLRVLLGWALLISLLLHFNIAAIFWFFLQPESGENAPADIARIARIEPEDVVNVELWGEVPRSESLTPPPGSEPEDQSQKQQPAETPPTLAEEKHSPTQDAIPLGPKADTKPPEIVKKKTPPPQVKPPEVKTPPEPEEPQKPFLAKMLPAKHSGPSLNSSPMRLLGSPEAANKDLAVSHYFNNFLSKIQRDWKPRGLGLGGRPEVWYQITIEPGGTISSVRLYRASGDPYFDRSVEVAIRGTSPLPPIPRSFGGQKAVSVFGFGLNLKR